MTQASRNPRGTIVAAVAFDAQTDAVTHTATALCRRYDMNLHLISVVEPTLANPWIQVSTAELAYFPIYPEVDEAERQDKLKRMEELARRLETPFKPTTSVAYGMKTQTLISEAVARRANLLITGFDPEAYRVTFSGVSTALTLLADAPLPVLAVTKDAYPDFNRKGFKMLIADDFTEATHEAVLKGMELASMLDRAEVRQVHVHGDFREVLKGRWADIKARFPGDGVGTITPESLWENEYQTLLAKGKTQGAPFRKKAELAGAKLELDVRTGNKVAEEFQDAVEEFNPDLVVFGRHRVLKARPFLIGRMPSRTMLQLRKPVLVVPPASELFARLPLPAPV